MSLKILCPPIDLETLIHRFTSQLETYQQTYNETQTRIEFINPLFIALGWDVNNEQGASVTYRPVVHEECVGRTLPIAFNLMALRR